MRLKKVNVPSRSCKEFCIIDVNVRTWLESFSTQNVKYSTPIIKNHSGIGIELYHSMQHTMQTVLIEKRVLFSTLE